MEAGELQTWLFGFVFIDFIFTVIIICCCRKVWVLCSPRVPVGHCGVGGGLGEEAVHSMVSQIFRGPCKFIMEEEIWKIAGAM